MKNKLKILVLAGVSLTPIGAMAAAGGGGGGTEFSGAKATATGWATGDLGMTIATAGGIWGMISAVGGNIKMAGLGVGIAAVAALSIPIIESVFGAVI